MPFLGLRALAEYSADPGLVMNPKAVRRRSVRRAFELCVFLTKSIIAKQFEGSRIKRMCIFHVPTVRGLPGSEGTSAPCMGLPSNAEAPLAMRLYSIAIVGQFELFRG